jgi:transposase-like protein
LFSFHFSFFAAVGESPMAPRHSPAKADNPFWSNHVAAWYRSALDAERYCRKHDLSTTSLMRWARHLLGAEDLRKRSEDLQKSRRKRPERQLKNRPLKRPKKPRRNRYSVRTDCGPIALRAYWGMHVEAMNWSGMGHAEYAAALGLSPHALRIWRDQLEQSGNEMDWRSLLHPSARAQLSSAANCARRRYRLTPEAADSRSNRRRFSDEQKRAIVQETEKLGASVAQVCRRHGIATSMVFRWRSTSALALERLSNS